MRNKGAAWATIFFLILMFVLMNTIDTSAYFNGVEIEAATPEGFNEELTITQPDTTPDTPQAIYQHFRLEKEPGPDTATITVQDSWLRKEGVDPRTVSISKETNGTWEELTITKREVFATETTYEVANLTQGEYLITGERGTAPKSRALPPPKTQLIILAGIITIILFLTYHHHSSREARQHERRRPGEQELHDYIKESLLAGQEEDDIKERLIKAGWEPGRVAQGLRRVRFL